MYKEKRPLAGTLAKSEKKRGQAVLLYHAEGALSIGQNNQKQEKRIVRIAD